MHITQIYIVSCMFDADNMNVGFDNSHEFMVD